MITIEPTQGQIERAKKKYPFDALNNSFTKGKGNFYGALGEIIVADYYSASRSVDAHDTNDYDMLISGKRVEVKSKHGNYPPRPYYRFSVAQTSRHQSCDIYMFVHIMVDLSKVVLVGCMPRKEFFERAFFGKKGELDTVGEHAFNADCWNMEIRSLREPPTSQEILHEILTTGQVTMLL